MIPEPKKQIAVIDRGAAVLVGLSAGLAILKLIQLFIYFDPADGLLRSAFARFLLDGVLAVGIAGLLAAGVLLARTVLSAGELPIRPLPIGGIALGVTAVCFLGQAILDVIGGFQKSGAYFVNAAYSKEPAWSQQLDWSRLILAGLGFLSAIALGFAAWTVISRRRPSAFCFLPPVLWSGLLLVDLLMSYPRVISFQSDASKTVCAVLTLLFVMDVAEQFTDDGAPDNWLRYLLRIAAPGVIFVTTLPYVVVWIFGIRDASPRVPYLALLGLSLYGAVNFMQISASAVHCLRKKQKLAASRSK